MAIEPEAVEAIARRVAELLSPAVASRYLDTAEVAEMLSVSEEWVRDHAAELGAVRLGAWVANRDPGAVKRDCLVVG